METIIIAFALGDQYDGSRKKRKMHRRLRSLFNWSHRTA